jgi:hypothetical protein
MKESRVIIAMAILSGVLSGAGATVLPAASETQITVFHPTVPSGPAAEGSCSGGANTFEDANACRCFKGDQIYDPCFSIKDNPGAVVCDADPASGKAGFLVKLKDPLPKRDALDEVMAKRPWIIKLADGVVCRPMDGAVGTIAGLEAGWDCVGSKSCADDDMKCIHVSVVDLKRGDPWLADEIRYKLMAHPKDHHDPWKLIERKEMPIAQVWGSEKLSPPSR